MAPPRSRVGYRGGRIVQWPAGSANSLENIAADCRKSKRNRCIFARFPNRPTSPSRRTCWPLATCSRSAPTGPRCVFSTWPAAGSGARVTDLPEMPIATPTRNRKVPRSHFRTGEPGALALGFRDPRMGWHALTRRSRGWACAPGQTTCSPDAARRESMPPVNHLSPETLR